MICDRCGLTQTDDPRWPVCRDCGRTICDECCEPCTWVDDDGTAF